MSRLMDYVSGNKLSELEEALKQVPPVIDVDEKMSGIFDGKSALHVAAMLNSIPLLRVLCSAGANIYARDPYGLSPAHYAAQFGFLGVLMELRLFCKSEKLRCSTFMRESLLFFAVRDNKEEVVPFLLQNSEPLVENTSYGEDVMLLACTKGSLSIVKRLLPFFEYDSSYMLAALSSNVAVAELLHTHYKIEVSQEDISGLPSDAQLYIDLHACADQASLIQFVAASSEKAQSSDLLLLMLHRMLGVECSRESQRAILSLILEDSSVDSIVVASMLLYPKNFFLFQQLLEDLLEKVVTFELHGQRVPPVCLALCYDDLNLWNELFSGVGPKGVLNFISSAENALLNFSVINNAINIFDYFCKECGLKPDVINHDGSSLLHVAARNRRVEFLRKLVGEYKLDPDIKDNSGQVAYELALERGFKGCLVHLLPPVSNPFSGKIMPKREMRARGIEYLVFQGASVKAIAFYYALKRLIDRKALQMKAIKAVAGSSSGSITALLLAIGFPLSKVSEIIVGLDFSSLLDEPLNDEFIEIKNVISKENGLKEFFGEALFEFVIQCTAKAKIEGMPAVLEEVKSKAGNLIFAFQPGLASNLLVVSAMKVMGLVGAGGDLLTKNILDLKSRLEPFFNSFIKDKGIFSGQALRGKLVRWMAMAGLDENLTFGELHERAKNSPIYKDLYLSVYDATIARARVFSYEATPDAIIVDTVRASASIQIFFVSHSEFHMIDGKRTKIEGSDLYDGGTYDNYMLKHFDKKKYIQHNPANPDEKASNPYVIGFRTLKSMLYRHYEFGEELEKSCDTKSDVFSFMKAVLLSLLSLSNQESNYSKSLDEQKRTVHIDDCGVKMLDFNLSAEQKSRLKCSAEEGAERFADRFFQSRAKAEQRAEFKKESSSSIDPPVESEASTDPSAEVGKTAIRGLNLEKVPADGHCFYHAVGLYLGKDQDQVRDLVYNYISTRVDEFSPFFNTAKGKSVKSYLENIKSGGKEWATNIEIEVLVRVMQRPVVILDSSSNLIHEANANIMEHQFAHNEPIFVSYTGNHYDALILDATAGLTPREILNGLLERSGIADSIAAEPAGVAPLAPCF